ncbi:DUF5688 family protein [Anaerovoracaceae bacterium 42-11]
MIREKIITELRKRGYHAEEKDVVKNGEVLEGIYMEVLHGKGTIIYPEKFAIDSLVNKIVQIFEQDKSLTPKLPDINKDFVENHIYIGMQKNSAEPIIKRASRLEGLESYLYLRWKEKYKYFTTRVSQVILDAAAITESKAWEFATINSDAEMEIKGFSEIFFEEEAEDIFYVISNKAKFRGASAILNEKALIEFGEKHKTNKLVVLPSSIHEMILVPYIGGICESFSEFTDIVKSVNNTVVKPEEELVDNAYMLTLRPEIRFDVIEGTSKKSK